MFMAGDIQHVLSLLNKKLTQVGDHTSGSESQGMLAVIRFDLLFTINRERDTHSIIYFEIGCVAGSATDQVIHEGCVVHDSLGIVFQQSLREIGELLKKWYVVGTRGFSNVVKRRGSVWPRWRRRNS